ncbi:MAG TPA: helix-turn-helix domain-containing protein [Candidatus Acidoferrum sp.]|nr:helix-turn-helix domain-containing protein [Candidatus Acidoferrum sp.]
MAGKIGMKSNQFSHETKLEAVRAHLEEGLSVREVMARFGISSRSTLQFWCVAYRKLGWAGLEPKPKGRRPAVPEGVEEELRRLRMENEVLRAFLSAVERR